MFYSVQVCIAKCYKHLFSITTGTQFVCLTARMSPSRSPVGGGPQHLLPHPENIIDHRVVQG